MSIVTIQTIRDELGLTNATQVPDTTVQNLIDVASGVIADRVGPLEPTQTTFVTTANSGRIALPNARIITIDSVTSPWYAAIDPTEILVTNGVIGLIYGVIPDGQWSVTYTAGWPTGGSPVQIQQAVIEQARHLWATRRGSTFRQPADGMAPATAHLSPWRVEELLAPYARVGGFA